MKGRHHQALVEKASGLDPSRSAVVHPVDTVSLLGAIEAAKQKLIVPVLIGPETKIRAAASTSWAYARAAGSQPWWRRASPTR